MIKRLTLHKRMLASALASVMLLGACAVPPRIADSKVLAQPETHIKQLIVVYRDVKLRPKSSYRFGNTLAPNPAQADTGIGEFGKAVVAEAEVVFADHQVVVQKALQLDEVLPLPSDAAVPVLIVEPASGRVQSSTMSTVASYAFNVQLLDPVRRRVLWQGRIDANAWVGKDFVMKNFEKTTYDSALARKFLQAIATKLSEDSFILKSRGA